MKTAHCPSCNAIANDLGWGIRCPSCGYESPNALMASLSAVATLGAARGSSTPASVPRRDAGPEIPVAEAIDVAVTDDRRTAQRAPRRPLRGFRGVHPIKLAMLAATILWPIGMVAFGVLGYTAAMRPVVREFAEGHYLLDEAHEFDVVPIRQMRGQAIASGISLGLTVPTFFYVVSMTVLAVLWFVVRPDRSIDQGPATG